MSLWRVGPTPLESDASRFDHAPSAARFDRERAATRHHEGQQRRAEDRNERPTTYVWSTEEAHGMTQPRTAEFNPGRSSHLYELARREAAAAEARKQAAQRADPNSHHRTNDDDPSLLGPPGDRSTQLYRLFGSSAPVPAVAVASRSSISSRVAAEPTRLEREVRRIEEARRTRQSSQKDDDDRTYSNESSPSSVGSVSTSHSSKPTSPSSLAPHAMAASPQPTSNQKNHANLTPQVANHTPRETPHVRILDIVSPIAGPPSTAATPQPAPALDAQQLELLEVERQLREVERELYGDAAVETDPVGGSTPDPVGVNQTPAPPTDSPSGPDPLLAAPSHPSPTNLLRRFLSTPEQQVLERYKLEQLEGSFDVLSSPIHPHSRLDDSIPSTICEEDGHITSDTSLETSRLGESQTVKRARPDSPTPSTVQNHIDVPPIEHSPTTTMADTSMPPRASASATLASNRPSSPAPPPAPASPPSSSLSIGSVPSLSNPLLTGSPSLSELLRLSDLRHPPPALTSTRPVTSWRAARPREELPAVLGGPRPWEDAPPAAAAAPSPIQRLHDELLSNSSIPRGRSSREALDPASRLLESLWEAEDEFERMIAEDLPADHADRRRRRMIDRNQTDLPPSNEPPTQLFLTTSPSRHHSRRTTRNASLTPNKTRQQQQYADDPTDAIRARHAAQTILDPREVDQNEFLAIRDLDEWIDPDDPTSSPPVMPSVACGNVLLGVDDWCLPEAVEDLLTADVAFDSRPVGVGVARLHPSRGIGHLAPIDAFARACEEESERRKRGETSRHEEDIKQQMEFEEFYPTPITNTGATTKKKNKNHSHNDLAKKPPSMPTPRSIYESAAERARQHAKMLSSQDAPVSIGSPRSSVRSRSHPAGPPPRVRSPSPPPFSHLHKSVEPSTLLRHLELRQVHDVIGAMDQDLIELEKRAIELSAEYQADQRKLEEYQKRLQMRKQYALSSQLSAAQRHWSTSEYASRAARSTLDEIDQIIARQERRTNTNDNKRSNKNTNTNTNTNSPPMTTRQSTVQHSPQPQPTPIQSLSFIQQLDAAASAHGVGAAVDPAPPSSAAVAPPPFVSMLTLPSPTPAPQTQIHTIPAATGGKKLIPVKKKAANRIQPRQEKISQDLDSALNAAQSLINQFMQKMK